jgi:hypothetical protein
MGERIVNGGFEFGLQDWIIDDAFYVVQSNTHHSGSYGCLISDSGKMHQTLYVKVSDIILFGYWAINCSNYIITFSDSSTFTEHGNTQDWTYNNIKFYLGFYHISPDLYVTKIEFNTGNGDGHIDDVSLQIADPTKSYGLDVILKSTAPQGQQGGMPPDRRVIDRETNKVVDKQKKKLDDWVEEQLRKFKENEQK